METVAFKVENIQINASIRVMWHRRLVQSTKIDNDKYRYTVLVNNSNINLDLERDSFVYK